MSYRPQEQPGAPGWSSQVEASASEPPPQGSGTMAEDPATGARSSSREPLPVRKPPKGRASGPRSQRSSSRDAALKCASFVFLVLAGACLRVRWCGVCCCAWRCGGMLHGCRAALPADRTGRCSSVKEVYSGNLRDESHVAGMAPPLLDIPWRQIQASLLEVTVLRSWSSKLGQLSVRS